MAKNPKQPTDEAVELGVVELEPRIHIKEFLLGLGMSPVQRAGFQAYCGKTYMRPDEWNAVLQEYVNRK